MELRTEQIRGHWHERRRDPFAALPATNPGTFPNPEAALEPFEDEEWIVSTADGREWAAAAEAEARHAYARSSTFVDTFVLIVPVYRQCLSRRHGYCRRGQRKFERPARLRVILKRATVIGLELAE